MFTSNHLGSGLMQFRQLPRNPFFPLQVQHLSKSSWAPTIVTSINEQPVGAIGKNHMTYLAAGRAETNTRNDHELFHFSCT